VIYDEIKKCHENFVMDQRISCSDGGSSATVLRAPLPPSSTVLDV
jgi:hypothetical protein